MSYLEILQKEKKIEDETQAVEQKFNYLQRRVSDG